MIVGIDGLETKVWGSQEGDVLSTSVTRRALPEGNGDENSSESASDTSDEDEDEDEDTESGSEDSGDISEEEEDASVSDDGALPPPSRSPSPAPSSDCDSSPSTTPLTIPLKPSPPQAENPETIRAAERLLSRTLASACAEDEGQGLAAEMGTPKPYKRLHCFSLISR